MGSILFEVQKPKRLYLFKLISDCKDRGKVVIIKYLDCNYCPQNGAFLFR